MKKKIAGIVFAVVLSWSCVSEAAAIVGFTGPYAPENWTVKSHALIALNSEVLQASFGEWSSFADFSITIVETGTITFDLGGVNRSEGGLLGGGLLGIVDTSVSEYYSSVAVIPSMVYFVSETINVVAGETLTFSMRPYGVPASGIWNGDVKVINFRAEGVPEPTSFGSVAAGLFGLAGFCRHRRTGVIV